MPELHFNPETHTYTVDGTVIPCVSDIIAILGKPIPEELEAVFEAAAERGTALHKVLEEYLTGNYKYRYPAEYGAYVGGIRLFLMEHFIEPYNIEQPIYNEKLNYAGTPDLVGMFDGELSIIDYKFVSQVDKLKVKAQLNAYRLAYESIGVAIEKLYAVQFLPTGAYRLYPVAVDNTEFTACHALYQAGQRKHGRGIIE